MLQIEKEHKRSTLMTAKKKDLVDQIMYLEHNNNVLHDTINQQAENYNILLQQTWIPVTERLPEQDMYCWVTIAYPGTVRCVHDGYYQIDTGFSWSNVVAWAPKDALKPYLN